MSDAVGFHSEIAEGFEQAYTVSPAFRERLELWSLMIERFGEPDMRVLDAGCGPGLVAARAAHNASYVLAFDASPAMIARARRNVPDNVECVVNRLETLHPAHRDFDLVLASSLLEYCDPFWMSFDRLVAALAPGGTLLVSLPNDQSLYRKIEHVVFRLFGRPRYRAHVARTPSWQELETGFAQRGLNVDSKILYGASAYLSSWARRVLPSRFTETLVLFAIRRDRI